MRRATCIVIDSQCQPDMLLLHVNRRIKRMHDTHPVIDNIS